MRCGARTLDYGGFTQCRLEAGHQELHDDGCLSWHSPEWKRQDPPMCDLCSEYAVWIHSSGANRCDGCPRPDDLCISCGEPKPSVPVNFGFCDPCIAKDLG